MINKQIIIPDMGLHQNRAKHLVPLQSVGENVFRCGLSYCRNISLSRKEGCISKSKGVEKFTASATGSTDSVRGIGIYNKYARPNDYEGSTTKYVAANTDDQHDDGTTLTDSSTIVRIGDDSGTNYDGIFRLDDWTIAQSTQIISADLKLWVKAKSSSGQWTVKIWGDDQQDPSAPADHAAYAAITKTTNSTTHPVGALAIQIGDVALNSEIIINVTDIVQELVDSYAHTNQAIQLLVVDNGSTGYIDFYPYNVGSSQYYAMLEITTTVGLATTPTYFMYVKGASAGEAWKLDNDKVPGEVTQSGESYASLYQSQTAKFIQFGDDFLMTDDGFNDAVQQWDISDNPSNLEDCVANYNGRYINEFKSRAWLIYPKISGTLYPNRAYYSDVNDQTSFSKYIVLPGSDKPTGVINLTQDDQIIFKEGSSLRIVDRQTDVSDFQGFLISSRDGLLSGNVISDGSRLYGLNEKGVFQWPVSGYPNGFRYIHGPIQDEIDKVSLHKMKLVWFAYDPIDNLIHMHYPDTGATRNSLDAIFNINKDTWENISDIYGGNIMIHAFHPDDGSSIMLWGEEDGHIKCIYGEDDDGSNYIGRFDTGAIYQLDNQKNLLSRKLISIEPDTNYDGSMTLNFYFKGYNRPDEESSASWNGPYTHDTTKPGNKEFVPINHLLEYQYHIIRMDGTLKDEAFEVYSLGLNFALGSR